MSAIPPEAVPFLPRGVRLHADRVRGVTVLLAPERALKLDATGAAVLAELDGRTSFGEMVARLAARYAAPAEQIAADADRFLAGLLERRMLELRP